MGNPVVHFEVVGKDADALRAYYGQLFGWEFDTDNAMGYGTVDREDNLAPEGFGIGGGIGRGPDGYEGHVTFYVGVDDVEAALEQAESLGGQRVMGPHEVEGAALVLGHFKDPEGNLIGVVKPLNM